MDLIRTWLVRLLGAILLAACAASIGGTAATAAPAVPTLAAIEIPDPQFPNAGMGGFIDPGPGALCTPEDKSRYCQYGYGGWLPITVDFGWGWVPDVVEDQVREGIQKVQDVSNPGNAVQERTGRALSNAMQFWVAVCVLLTRLIFNAPGLWGVFDPITDFLQHMFGGRVLAMFFTLAVSATAIFIAMKADKGDVKWAMKVTRNGFLIIGIGALCAGWALGPGAFFDKALNTGFAAVSQAAGGEARSAEVATANVMIDTIVWPTFVTSNFGDNKAAADKYAERVHAASAFTRDQTAAMRVSKDVENQALDQKRVDLEAVVKEIEAEYPDVYKNYFRNHDTMTRGMAGAAGLLAAVSAGLVLLAALTVIGLARLAVRFIVAIFPTVALVLQFPTMQHYAGILMGVILKAFVFMLGAVVVYVIYLNVIISGIMSADIDLIWRVVAIMLVVALLWTARGLITEQVRIAALKLNDARKNVQQKLASASGAERRSSTTVRDSDSGSGTGSRLKLKGSRNEKPRSKPVDRAVVEQSDPALIGETKWAPLANPDRYQYRTNEKGRLEQTEFGRKVEADKARTTLKQKSAVNAAALAAVVVTKDPKTGATVKKAATKAADVGAQHKARKTRSRAESGGPTRQQMRSVPQDTHGLTATQMPGMFRDLSKVQLPKTPADKAPNERDKA